MKVFRTIKVTTNTWICKAIIMKKAITPSTTMSKRRTARNRCKTASKSRFTRCRIRKATKFLIHNRWKEGLSATSKKAWILHNNRISRTNSCRYLTKVVILSKFKTISCQGQYMEEATQAASTRIFIAFSLSIQCRIQFRIVCLAIAFINLVLFQEANYSVMAKDLEVEQSLHLKSEAIPPRQGTTVSSALVWIQMASAWQRIASSIWSQQTAKSKATTISNLSRAWRYSK